VWAKLPFTFTDFVRDIREALDESKAMITQQNWRATEDTWTAIYI